MIGIADWTSRGKNLCQDLLALFERDAPQIVAVDIDEIENSGFCFNKVRELVAFRILNSQIVLITRNQADSAVFDKGNSAIAIPFDLEYVFWIVEWLFNRDGQHGMDGDWHRA